MSAPDPFGLERFLDAQDGVYGQVLAELRTGRKASHWMWFIFPQIDGLGHSATARHFAIRGLAQARAYLAHPVLGARLAECTRLVNAVAGASAHDIFGSPDDLKFRSSMTLFELAADDPSEYRTALDRYYAGQADARTVALAAQGVGPP
jgi:uncharacterized protein (DUF1810 family)